MNPSELYHLDNVKQRYGGSTVLSLPQLTLQTGELCALIGANGAGKSTLLSLLAFLEHPAAGEIRYRGEVVSSRRRRRQLRRHVVLLDQEPIMFTGTVLRNVEYGLKLHGVAGTERRQRAQAALERVGLGNFARRNARRLSGGETKRVALARALVLQPEVLLCDEPTANVDAENQEIILEILEQASQEGSTVIFSTHSLSQSRRLARRTLQLEHGRLCSSEEQNLFRAGLEWQEKGVRCSLGSEGQGLSFLLPQRYCRELVPKSRFARLCIEVRGLGLGRESGPGLHLRGPLTAMEVQGGEILFHVDVGVPLRFYVREQEYYRLRPFLGEVVPVVIPPDALRLSSLAAG